MPARLVYAPRTYVYTKNQAGTLYNLSTYVTAGNIERKIDQPSTATVTLRNPYKRFTTPSQGVAFHPMDPITIYLERIPGKPVRVFTGYLDTTPYYQLYPGTITLNATCTLKRLLYSWFDPSLPYLIAFFEKYGWINTGKGSIISQQAFDNQSAATQASVNAGTKPFTALKDGSLGKLLWATLYDIGQWQDSNIYIEALPSGADGIAARMASLMQSMEREQAIAADDFTQFLQTVVGAGSQGSGGGTGDTGTGSPTLKGNSVAAQIWNFFTQTVGLPPPAAAGFIGNWVQESNLNPSSPGGYIAQWGGDRLAGLQAYAAQRGKPVTDLAMQLGWAWYELNTGYTSVRDQLKHVSSASSAATIICNDYEMPLASAANLPHRIQAANDAMASFGASAGNALDSLDASQLTPGFIKQSGKTAPASSSGKITRIDAITSAAQDINDKHYPYVWGGGHSSLGTPSGGGFDCSGAVGAVLCSANILPPGSSIGNEASMIAELQQKGVIDPGPGTGSPEVTLYDNPGVHIYMRINGRYWGTAAGGHIPPNSPGGGWVPNGGPQAGFNEYHVKTNILNQMTNFALPGGGNITSSGSQAGGGADNTASAQAFVAELQFPSVEDQVAAIALGAEHKGLMHDQSLMPFIQQLCQASMRSFQSLPNGDFFAFYPDYFGEMGHHDPYWIIDDIEILDGKINLTDDSLATHVFAVGDNTWPVNNELLNELFSAGTINVFNAFLTPGILDTTKTPQHGKGGMADIMSQEEAVKFIQRYGARPLVQNYPMVRSPIYEMLLAYQQFMLAWSNQFKTPFTFTFMPELFPGGKVAFANHGLQMYVNSVTHSWDYGEGGFTTTAELSAPSRWGADNADLPPYMVQAMVEPIRKAQTSSGDKAIQQADQQVASVVDRGITDVVGKIISEFGL